MTDTDEFSISFEENEMERLRNSVIVPVVPVISRKEFVKMFARDYHAGQHVTFLGPSGRGKTKLMGQLLLAVLRYHKDITARVLHGKIKGRDETIIKLSKEGKLPITPEATPSWWQKNVSHRDMRGYIVRPLTKAEGSPDSKEDLTEKENQHLRRVFRRVIYKAYHAPKKKPVIVVVDEAHQAHTVLRLKSDCEGPLMRGRPVCAVCGHYCSADGSYPKWSTTNQNGYSSSTIRLLKTNACTQKSVVSIRVYWWHCPRGCRRTPPPMAPLIHSVSLSVAQEISCALSIPNPSTIDVQIPYLMEHSRCQDSK